MISVQISPTVTGTRRSLAPAVYSTYVRDADGQYFRLCRIQPPGAAPGLKVRGFQRFSSSFMASAARGNEVGGFKLRRRRSQVTSVPGTAWTGGTARYPDPARGRHVISRRALGAKPGQQRLIRGGPSPSEISYGPTLDAPDCADQIRPTIRDAAGRSLHAPRCVLGLPFGPARDVALWPSPHPRIRWTVASPGSAIRAHGESRPPPPRVKICPTRC